MLFRVRDGFRLHTDSGSASGGHTVTPTLQELKNLRDRHELGILEPLDAEAKNYFGNTEPRKIETTAPQAQIRETSGSNHKFSRGETIGFEDFASMAREINRR